MKERFDMNINMTTHTARCHCNRVQFEFNADIKNIWTCNCSLCVVRDGHWAYLNKEQLTFIRGEELLKSYRYNTHTSQNMFCRICGIHLLCQPRVYPDRYAVRLECVEGDFLEDVAAQVYNFDGRNWKQSVQDLHATELESVDNNSFIPSEHLERGQKEYVHSAKK